MKPIAQSVALSIVASVLASWLLRRLIFLAEQPGMESRGEHQSPAVVVVMPIVVGNTIGGPTIVPHARKLPVLGRKAAKH